MHGPKEWLSTYQRYIQCDGWKVYDGMAKKNSLITLMGCLAHTRRKYFDAEKMDKRASEPLRLIQQIYGIEWELKSNYSENGAYTQVRHSKMKTNFRMENLDG